MGVLSRASRKRDARTGHSARTASLPDYCQLINPTSREACAELDPAVILLDPVVEPTPTPVPGEAPQPALLLHLKLVPRDGVIFLV